MEQNCPSNVEAEEVGVHGVNVHCASTDVMAVPTTNSSSPIDAIILWMTMV